MSRCYKVSELDAMQCRGENCDHSECGELYFHANCHGVAGFEVFFLRPAIEIVCNKCREPVAQFIINLDAADDRFLEDNEFPISADCHPDAGFLVSYIIGSSRLRLHCKACRSVFKIFRLCNPQGDLK